MTKLEKIRKELASLDMINYGGCGIAAHMIAEAVPYARIYYCYSTYCYYSPEELESGANVSASHVLVKVGDNRYMDAKREYTKKELLKEFPKGYKVVSKQRNLQCLEEGDWNSDFKRRDVLKTGLKINKQLRALCS